ncbi:hemerythrin domain-containing protein [Azospirillum sp. sgz301742]
MATDTGWFSGRSLAAFAGGAVVALIASRVLPPILAQAAGSAQAAAGRDPFDALAEDHRAILSLLDALERSPDNAPFNRTQLLLRLKRRLAAHALAEEDVVYPLLFDRARATEDTRHLYDEHADMKVRLFALEQTPKDDQRWNGLVRELKTLIEGHIRQEEEVDFPKLRERLDKKDTVLVSGTIQREKALIL